MLSQIVWVLIFLTILYKLHTWLYWLAAKALRIKRYSPRLAWSVNVFWAFALPAGFFIFMLWSEMNPKKVEYAFKGARTTSEDFNRYRAKQSLLAELRGGSARPVERIRKDLAELEALPDEASSLDTLLWVVLPGPGLLILFLVSMIKPTPAERHW
jgi:hypothetical protein